MPQRENPTDFGRGSVRNNSMPRKKPTPPTKKKAIYTLSGVLDTYKPDLTPIQKMKIQMELQAEPTFARVFSLKYNLTPFILNEAKARYNPKINEENHNVWECCGMTGDGKSIGMLSLVKFIHPPLNINNIFFHDEHILEALPELKRPDWIIRDENIGGANYGSGSNRIKSQLDAVTQTLRKRCIGFTFIGVQPAELTTTQYLFKAIDKDREQRITRFAVKDPLTGIYLGAIYIPVMQETDPFWIAYNEKKEKFMQSIIEQDYSEGKPKYQRMVDIIMDAIDLSIYQKKKERKIFIQQKFTNLTKGEVEELSTMLEMQLRNAELNRSPEQEQSDAPVQEGEG
jgi:hypothetical protein